MRGEVGLRKVRGDGDRVREEETRYCYGKACRLNHHVTSVTSQTLPSPSLTLLSSPFPPLSYPTLPNPTLRHSYSPLSFPSPPPAHLQSLSLASTTITTLAAFLNTSDTLCISHSCKRNSITSAGCRHVLSVQYTYINNGYVI